MCIDADIGDSAILTLHHPALLYYRYFGVHTHVQHTHQAGGIDLDSSDGGRQGNCSLHWAASFASAEVVKLLCNRGVSGECAHTHAPSLCVCMRVCVCV